jgi:biopolymer transport protein ExbD
MGIPAPGRVGIIAVLIGLGVFCCTTYWYSTRTFVALDDPITLHHGHILSREFNINLPQSYSIEIETDGRERSLYPECEEYLILQSQWTLTKNGEAVSRSGEKPPFEGEDFTRGSWLGYFDANKGDYRLEINEDSDPSCLNSINPRLQIAIGSYDHDGYREWNGAIEWLSLILAGAGLVLVIRSKASPFAEDETPARLIPWLPSGPCADAWTFAKSLRARRLARYVAGPWERGSLLHVPFLVRDPAKALPTISLCVVLTLCTTLLLPWWVIGAAGEMLFPPVGLMVRVPGPRTVVSSEFAGQGLVVRIDAQHRWFLNSLPVTPAELPGALRARLDRQASGVVYFDGASNLEFWDAMRAISIIRNEDAVVILVTSDTAKNKAETKTH